MQGQSRHRPVTFHIFGTKNVLLCPQRLPGVQCDMDSNYYGKKNNGGGFQSKDITVIPCFRYINTGIRSMALNQHRSIASACSAERSLSARLCTTSMSAKSTQTMVRNPTFLLDFANIHIPIKIIPFYLRTETRYMQNMQGSAG